MATAKKKRKPGEPSPAQLRARRRFAAMAKARAKAARAAKKAAGIKPKKRNAEKTVVTCAECKRQAYADRGRIRHKPGCSKKAAPKKAAPKRKRNVLSPDRNHPIEVTRHWRKGGASAWQRAEAAGQKRLFAMNPLSAAQAKKLREEWFYLRGKGTRRTAAEKKRQAAIYKAILRYEKSIQSQKKNPSSGLSRAKAQHKQFLGRPSRKTKTVYVPKGSKVKGALSAMGKLHRIKVRGRTAFDFSKGNIFLARDGRNKMHVAGKGYKIMAKGKRRNPDGFEDLGVIESIEYVATKSHLDGEPTIYVHKMGEEGGEKPHLLINDEGLALIDGGDYTITERGIEN